MVGLAGRTGLLTDYLPSQDKIVAPRRAMAQGVARTVMESGWLLVVGTVLIQFQFLDSRDRLQVERD